MSIKEFSSSVLVICIYLAGCNNSDSEKKEISDVTITKPDNTKIPKTNQHNSGQNSSQQTDTPIKKIKKLTKNLSPFELAEKLLQRQTNNYEINDNRIYNIDIVVFVKDHNLGDKDADSLHDEIADIDKKLNQIYNECREKKYEYFNENFTAVNQIFIDCVTQRGINENTRRYIEIKKDYSELALRN